MDLTRLLAMASMLNMTGITGRELRRRREAAGVKQWEVASVMRVASSRVSQIEALAKVTQETSERYLVALDSCLVAKSPQEAAGAA